MRQRGHRINLQGLSAYKVGASRSALQDPYYFVLAMGWGAFFAWVLAIFLAANLFFAGLYWMVPGALANARPHNFGDAFFFSVETLATVGYGEMTPASTAGHAIATTEIFAGMFLAALVTGGFIARFSRPRPRLIFSQAAVIAPYEGVQALMVRVASRRLHSISEVRGRINYLCNIELADGNTIRRFIDLKLIREENPVLSLSWTLIHPIDQDSPLNGATPETLMKDGSSLMVSIRGFDEAISSAINDRHLYRIEDIRFGHAFVNILRDLPDGAIELDLTRIHDTTPVTRPERYDPVLSDS